LPPRGKFREIEALERRLGSHNLSSGGLLKAASERENRQDARDAK